VWAIGLVTGRGTLAFRRKENGMGILAIKVLTYSALVIGEEMGCYEARLRIRVRTRT